MVRIFCATFIATGYPCLIYVVAQTKVLRQKLASLSDADRTRDFSLEEFQMRAGHKMKDMLKACKWRDLTCSYMDFKPVSVSKGISALVFSAVPPKFGVFQFQKFCVVIREFD